MKPTTRKAVMPQDYSWVTQEMFDQKLEALIEEDKHVLMTIPGVYEAVSEEFYDLEENEFEGELAEMSGGAILAIPGMYEVLAEEYNNFVLQVLEDERDEGSGRVEADLPLLEQQEELLQPQLGEELTRSQQIALLRSGVENWNKWVRNSSEFPNLAGADLAGADLAGADLKWANLTRTNLKEADLYGADLKWANLTRTNLKEADLAGANLYEADLAGADFTGVLYNSATIFPKEFDFSSFQMRKASTKMRQRKQAMKVKEEDIYNLDEWEDDQFDYLIIASFDGGISWEVVDGDHDRYKAEELLPEYTMAYGPDTPVRIFDMSHHYVNKGPYPTEYHGRAKESHTNFAQYKKAQMEADVTLLKKSFDDLGKAATKDEAIALLRDISDAAQGIMAELSQIATARVKTADLQTDYLTLKNAINSLDKATEKEDLVLALQDLADSATGILDAIAGTKSAKVEKTAADLDEEAFDFDFDAFFEAYVETALWASVLCDEEGNNCRSLKEDYDSSDISDKCLEYLKQQCLDFVEGNEALVQALEMPHYDVWRAGQDFWLTHEGHGAGFWDSGLGDLGNELTKASKFYGGVDFYVGDDGQLYC